MRSGGWGSESVLAGAEHSRRSGADTASVKFERTCGNQTPEPVPVDRPHNLREPRDADDDHGAHGIFDAQAHRTDPQQWFSRRPGLATAAAIATGLLAAAARWRHP